MNANLQMLRRSPSAEQLKQQNLRLRIGDHAVDVGALRVVGGDEVQRLTSKAVAVLLELVRHAGNTVGREDLLERVWKDRVTTPDVLTQAIKELRRAFGDGDKPARYIETIPKVGYRLLADVSVIEADEIPFGRLEHFARRAENETWADANGEAAVADPHAVTGPSPATVNDVSNFRAAVAAAASTARGRRKWLWFALSPLLLLALAGAAYWMGVQRASRPPWRTSNVRAVTSDPGAELRPRLSPDGTRVAYGKIVQETGFDRLYIRTMEQQSQLVALAPHSGSAHDALPAWSPDGSRIAYERVGKDKCTLYVVASLGGREREIGDCQDFMTSYFDFTPDGQALVTALRLQGAQSDLTLVKWNIASGVKEPFRYQRSPGDQDLEPRYSPDGRWIAFRRGLAPYSDLYLMRADGGEVRALTHVSSRIRGYTWTADGSALVFSSNQQGQSELYAVDIDDGRLQRLGIVSANYPDAARNGRTVVYEIARAFTGLVEIDLDAEGRPSHKLAASTGSDSSPALSPDGKYVAFLSNRSGSMQLWLYEPATDSTFALTDYRDAAVLNPIWRSDSAALLIGVRQQSTPTRLVEIDLASRRERVLSGADENVLFGNYGVQPDTFLLSIGTTSRGARLIQREHIGTAQQADRVLATGVEHAETDAAHNQVYYTRVGRTGLFRYDLGSGEERPLTDKITSVAMEGWRLIGGNIWHVDTIDPRSTFLREFDPQAGEDHLVAELPFKVADLNFSITPDGKRLYLAPFSSEDTDVGAFDLERVH